MLSLATGFLEMFLATEAWSIRDACLLGAVVLAARLRPPNSGAVRAWPGLNGDTPWIGISRTECNVSVRYGALVRVVTASMCWAAPSLAEIGRARRRVRFRDCRA